MLFPINKIKRELFLGLHKLLSITLNVNYFGEMFKVPLIGNMGRDLVVPDEYLMTSILESALTLKPGIVIDIGANVGIFLFKLKSLRRNRSYIAFEPNPSSAYYLTELIRINNFNKCEVNSYALSNKDGQSRLNTSRPGDPGASLDENFTGNLINVLTRSGDSSLAHINEKIGVIKIDVEGHEYNCLCGLKKTIKKNLPFIYCEVWGFDINDKKKSKRLENAIAIFNLLAKLNYVAIGITRKKHDATILSSANQFNKNFRDEYIFIHEKECKKTIEVLKIQMNKNNLHPGRRLWRDSVSAR